MSKAIADRRWPICGGACTVAPHTYSDTRPGTRGVNSRTSRVAVSCRRRVTLPRLWDAQACPRRLFPPEEPGQAPSACHPFPVCRPDLPAMAGGGADPRLRLVLAARDRCADRRGGRLPRHGPASAARRGRPDRPRASNGSTARPRHPMTDRHPVRVTRRAQENSPPNLAAGPYPVGGWPGRRFRTRTSGRLTARSR